MVKARALVNNLELSGTTVSIPNGAIYRAAVAGTEVTTKDLTMKITATE